MSSTAVSSLRMVIAAVVLVAGPSGHFDLLGYAFGLSAAFFFALYTVFAEEVGKDDDGLGGLALSVTVGAVVLDEVISPLAWAGIVLVSGAGALLVWASGRGAPSSSGRGSSRAGRQWPATGTPCT